MSTSIPLPEIKPQGSVKLNLWLRGSVVGPQSVRMLFHYEPVVEGAINHKMDYRLCRFSQELQVIPSLRVNCRAMSAPTELEQHQLMVEVENLLPDANFVVRQTSIAALNWALKLKSRINIPGREALNIVAPSQRTTLGFVLEPAKQDLQEGQLLASDISFPDTCMDITADPLRYLMEAAKNQTSKDAAKESSHGDFSSSRKKQEEATMNVEIVVAWQMQTKDTSSYEGQHLVSLPLTLPVEMGRTFHRSPIKMSVDTPPSIIHDFSAECTCVVPVKISIINCCETKPLSITFEALATDDEGTGSVAAGAMAFTAPYTWVGTTRKSFSEEVLPGDCVNVDTAIALWGQGLYNLNRFRVRVIFSNAPAPLVCTPPIPHMLSIRCTSDSGPCQ